MKKSKKKDKKKESAPGSKQTERRAVPFYLQSRSVPLWIAMAVLAFYGQLLFGKYWMWEDAIGYHFANIKFAVDQLRQGVFPWWNPYNFGGNVYAADIQTCTFYPGHWLFLLWQLVFGVRFASLPWYLCLHLIWMGIGQYHLLRGFDVGRKAALLGAVGLVLSGYVTGQYIHLVFILAAVWMPWSFHFFRKMLQESSWRAAILSGLCAGMSMLGGLPQVSAHFFYFLGIYGVYHLVSEKRKAVKEMLLPAARIAGVFVIALGIAAIGYLQTMDLIEFTPRQQITYEEAVDDSLLPGRLITFLAPGFYGNVNGVYSNRPAYWGDGGIWLYWECQVYIGLLLIFFAVIGFLQWRSPLRYFLLAAVIFSVIASMGKTFPLFKLVFYTVPGMRLFRVPARFLFYLPFCASILAAIGLQSLWSISEERKKILLKTCAIAAGVFAALWVLFKLGMFSDAVPAFSKAENYAKAGNEWLWQAMVCGGIAAGLYQIFKDRKSALGFGVLLLVLCLDLYRAHGTFNHGEQTPDQFFPQSPLVEFLQKKREEGLFRINARVGRQMVLQKRQGMVHGVFTLQGYNPLRPVSLIRAENQWPLDRVWDLYNARYGIVVDPKSKRMGVQERPSYLPRFWFADSVEVEPDTGLVFKRIAKPEFPYRKKVLLTKSIPAFQPVPFDSVTDRIHVKSYQASEIELEVECGGPKMLIASENYYPAWKAEIDGEFAEMHQANRCFWALPLPPGKHTVRFFYSSGTFRAGAFISLLFWIGAGFGLWYLRPGSDVPPTHNASEPGRIGASK